ncbi:MAG: hypothetical protein MI919_01515 [Holophagales bacterium]|nr:hypothetical protein [Holophagales bacterium]
MNPFPAFPSRRGAPACAAALLTLLAGSLADRAGALHPNHPLGSDPERAFQVSAEGIDKIDLYSGTLGITLPIGPFKLINNSNIWHYRTDPKTGEILARPDWENTAGIGWRLGWGEVYHPSHPYNESDEWLYVDDAGGRHALYDKLHRDDGDDGDSTQNPRVFYSRDGSYLRMRLSDNNCFAYIESRDGTTRRFRGSCGPLTAYRIDRIWSPFASESDPDVTITYGVDPADPDGTDDTLRTVTNRYGLTHRVYLTDKMNGDPQDPIHFLERIVTRVDIETFDAQLASYSFTYRQFHLDRSCKADAGGRIPVPHLERVDLPDGTSYSMVEGDDFLYENRCRWIDGHLVDDLPGVLTGLELPSGGQIRWTYQRYEFPPGDSTSVFNTGAGVKTRTLHTAGATANPGNAIGTWTYKTTSIPPMQTGNPDEPTHPEMHTEVVYPTGDCSKHFFNAIYWADPVNSSGSPWGWERGLPFVYSEESDGKYLSTQIFTGHTGNGSCDPATKLRSTYLRYRHDTTPGSGSGPLSEWYDTNRQVEASRTVFHDDGDWFVDVEMSDFDGLGNFRQRVETSNLWGNQERTTTTAFSRSSGTYPGTYTALHISEPWILGVFDSLEIHDAGATGTTTQRTEYSFQDSTGFPECSRALASAAGRGPSDLLRVNIPDSLGRVLDTKLYGGDRQTLSTTGDGCGTLPTQPVYWTSHEYDPLSGARTQTWPRHPNGAYGSFPIFDVDVEPRTGLVLRSRNSAGFETSFDYDAAGRLVSATPESGARVVYAYNTDGTLPLDIRTTWEPSTTGGFLGQGDSPLAETQVVLDDFGRDRLQRRKLPQGVWSEREVLYNARGWVESVSQWGDLTKKTRYLDYDPYGRAGTVRPPDGAAHDVSLSYRGQRMVSETRQIALAGGETPVTRFFLYDGFGRLIRVWEGSGTGGTLVSTTYAHDVAGRLTRVEAGQQVRTFEYDGRGLKLSETHPEKGIAGNGTVTYSDFDAAGLAHAKVDGPNDLTFTFDFLGRPLTIRDRSNSSRLVSSYRWDTGAGFGMGKLHYADRLNYVDLPWNATGEEQVRVRQSFAYQGKGGAISKKTTDVIWSADNARFVQDRVYDELGNLSQRTTPYCQFPTNCATSGAGASETLSFVHEQGRLVAVPGWANSITYHPSGIWQRITHANGISEHRERDPHFTRRTRRISTTGGSTGWDSGAMLYDGAGNLKSQGSDTFTYDQVSRLMNASVDSSFQGYSYDRWGNLTSVIGDTTGMFLPPVDPDTNRLTGVQYDAAGNMLTAPFPNPPGSYVYDTSNRLVAQATMRYLYDAFGERAMSISIGATESVAAVFHLRDLDHRLMSNLRVGQDGWNRDRDYVYADGRLIGRSALIFNGKRHFHLDRMGSVRLATYENGSRADENVFLPYGERFSDSTTDSLLFAGPHERDFSTDTDYMHARHYWWKLGRFLGTDPILGSSAEPQTWNRYSYVTGNPLKYTDPDGRFRRHEGNESGGPNDGMLWLIFYNPFLYFSDTITVTAQAPTREPRRPSVSPWPLAHYGYVPPSSRSGPARPRGPGTTIEYGGSAQSDFATVKNSKGEDAAVVEVAETLGLQFGPVGGSASERIIADGYPGGNRITENSLAVGAGVSAEVVWETVTPHYALFGDNQFAESTWTELRVGALGVSLNLLGGDVEFSWAVNISLGDDLGFPSGVSLVIPLGTLPPDPRTTGDVAINPFGPP